MKCAIVYLSPNGTTKILTRSLIKDLSGWIETDMIDLAELNRSGKGLDFLADYDLLGIGAPTYQLRPVKPVRQFIKDDLPRLNHKPPVFVFTTYAGISTGKSLLNMAKSLHRNDFQLTGAMKVAAPHFWKSYQGFPDDEVQSILKDFSESIRSRMNHFPEWDHFQRSLKYQIPFIRFFYPFAEWIGKIRNQSIRIQTDLCTQCGACVKQCPTSALTLDPFPVNSKRLCIHCSHCVKICPKGAMTVSIAKIEKHAETNRRIAGLEQPQNAVY